MTSPADAPPPENRPKPGRNAVGRFVRGTSGNPKGRPAGFRNAIAAELDARGMADCPAVYAAILTAALGGDVRAAAILLERWWPVVKRTPLDLPGLPRAETAEGLVKAHANVIERAAKNEISAEQAEAAAKLIEGQRRLIELTEIGYLLHSS